MKSIFRSITLMAFVGLLASCNKVDEHHRPIPPYNPDDEPQVSLCPPELVSGVFTVSPKGEQVKFTKGNLYLSGLELHCEDRQYDFGHFFWSKSVSRAFAASFDDPYATVADKLFIQDICHKEGFTVLSKEEWDYLIANALAKNSKGGIRFDIDGHKCIIFKPDGFRGVLNDNYTTEEWLEAESTYGLVALPYAGVRGDTTFFDSGVMGFYWSSSPHTDHIGLAYCVYFTNNDINTSGHLRGDGYSIRLVQKQ